MSKADEIFISMCNDIIENGFSSEGYDVRPRWEDGIPAHTIKKFGVINRYDLQKEFPALTLRKTYIKSAVNEMLWIWQKNSNDVHDLKSHVWDEWADEDGRIGKAYGYQQGLLHPYNGVTEEGLKKVYPDISSSVMKNKNGHDADFWSISTKSGSPRLIAIHDEDYMLMTQFDKAIYDLVNNPLSRRTIVTMWNPEDLHEMALEPCAYSMTFNVTGNRLNAILNQRSQDVLAANNWNVVQYSVLLMMVAQVTGLQAGELVHVISDAHIYDRHVDIVKELISREPMPAPKVELNPDVKSFYDFTEDDLMITDYNTHPQIKDIPIAV